MLIYVARAGSSMSQTGLALYALYSTTVSAAAVVTLTLAAFAFNLIELLIDGLWPPHRFHRHELPHEQVSLESRHVSRYTDVEKGHVPSLDPLDMELVPFDSVSIGVRPVAPERQMTTPPQFTIRRSSTDDEIKRLPPQDFPSKPCPAYQRPVEVAP
jgi:hypothetical protein